VPCQAQGEDEVVGSELRADHRRGPVGVELVGEIATDFPEKKVILNDRVEVGEGADRTELCDEERCAHQGRRILCVHWEARGVVVVEELRSERAVGQGRGEGEGGRGQCARLVGGEELRGLGLGRYR
jgi:hypothetical protein